MPTEEAGPLRLTTLQVMILVMLMSGWRLAGPFRRRAPVGDVAGETERERAQTET